MTLSDLAWVCVCAYGIHILEEFTLNWRDWARAYIGLPVTWPDFYIVNALVIVLGFAAACLAPTQPLFPLSFAALMLINAVLFHILPIVRSRGHFSPGLVTAVILFLPLAIWCYVEAAREGNLGWGTGIGSFVIGALLMASPIVLLKVQSLPYFQQPRSSDETIH
jgi:hypothetical protein